MPATKKLKELKVFNLTINHNKTIEDLVKAGCYDAFESKINSKNFGDDRKGTEEAEVCLLTTENFFGHKVTDKVLQAMSKKGFKPAGQIHGIRALLTLGKEYPNEQREGGITDFGSIWRISDDICNVPLLWSYEHDDSIKRGLHTVAFKNPKLDRSPFRFVAVRA